MKLELTRKNAWNKNATFFWLQAARDELFLELNANLSMLIS